MNSKLAEFARLVPVAVLPDVTLVLAVMKPKLAPRGSVNVVSGMLTGTVGPAAVAQKLLWFASAVPQTFSFPLTDIKIRDPSGTMPAARPLAGMTSSNTVKAIRIEIQICKRMRFMVHLPVSSLAAGDVDIESYIATDGDGTKVPTDRRGLRAGGGNIADPVDAVGPVNRTASDASAVPGLCLDRHPQKRCEDRDECKSPTNAQSQREVTPDHGPSSRKEGFPTPMTNETQRMILRRKRKWAAGPGIAEGTRQFD